MAPVLGANLVAQVAIVVTGGLVRVTGSGLGCPTWPECARARGSSALATTPSYAEQAEQARIDAILDKVSAHGMQSLTWWEKRTLRKATERQRHRDLELSKMRY